MSRAKRVDHDYRRDGARPVFSMSRGRVFTFMHDRARWHLNRSAELGVSFVRWQHSTSITLELWRWSLTVGAKRRGAP